MSKIENLSFSEYNKLPFDENRIAQNFQYTFVREVFKFENCPINIQSEFWYKVEELKAKTLARITTISLNSEAAKREVLIAPILLLLFDEFKINFSIEYQLNIASSLKGKLDYLLEGNQNIVVIEAKKDDFDGGAKQIIPELIALSDEKNINSVYGIVTNGRIWQFYYLDRTSFTIKQDLNLYNFPQEARKLFEILLSILG